MDNNGCFNSKLLNVVNAKRINRGFVTKGMKNGLLVIVKIKVAWKKMKNYKKLKRMRLNESRKYLKTYVFGR